jgi:hypothetical protein
MSWGAEAGFGGGTRWRLLARGRLSRVRPPEAPPRSTTCGLRLPAPSPREQNGLARSCLNAATKQKGDEVVRKTTLVFSVIWALVTVNGRLNAQSGPSQFVPFKEFIANTTAANSAEYLTQSTNHVKNASEFEDLRQHILTMYQGVEVSHSFVLHSQYFDCVPTNQQPSVRLLGLKSTAQPPPMPALGQDGLTTEAGEGAKQVGPGDEFDEFGNPTHCEENTIPVRRITLDELSRFETLQDFFKKSPDSVAGAAVTHKYAYANQTVNNFGGNSALNLWRPPVDTSKGEVFSLSQVWYSGGSGNSLQTAEGGWQNYPGKYGTQNSVLFIYWTADGYQTTGCYNLDCAAFVQTNNSYTLGGQWSNYSTLGGTQYDFTVVYELYRGNWWFGISAKNPFVWVGYYPGSLYRGGQLTMNAQTITYGGETTGSTIWPPMGSGQWAGNAGFGRAAYQRQIFYVDTTYASQWANLTPQQPSPNCYNLSGPIWGGNQIWGIYFYFGGPGGREC